MILEINRNVYFLLMIRGLLGDWAWFSKKSKSRISGKDTNLYRTCRSLKFSFGIRKGFIPFLTQIEQLSKKKEME